MQIRLTWDGGEVARTLAQLSVRATKHVTRAALEEGAELIRREAEIHAPIGPEAPHLRANIGISAAQPGPDIAALKIGPTKGFAYGLPQEFGTVKMPAHPFMRPAFDNTVEPALGAIGRAFWRELAGRGFGRSVSRPVPVQSLGGLL